MNIKKQLELERAKPGMTLAQEVLDSTGHCLVAADTTLTESHVTGLKRRGIQAVVIWTTEELSLEEIAARREAIQARLDQRFRQVLHEPNMQQLKDTLLAYRLEGLEQPE